MRVITGWIVLAALTVVGLLYTHSQVMLVRQSYALNQRLERRDDLHEHYTYLQYDVMALKAPNRLKERMVAFNVELTPPTSTQTIAPAPSVIDQRAHRWMPQWLARLEAPGP